MASRGHAKIADPQADLMSGFRARTLVAGRADLSPMQTVDRSQIRANRIDNHSHLRSNTPNGAKLLNYVRLHLQIGHRQTNPPRRGQGRGQPV